MTTHTPSSETFLGHPKGLFVCFMTELWERFSYYGMLSLLILYLTKNYQLPDAESNRIVAAYGALIWMLPVIGGIVADRMLGSRKAVIAGMLFMSLGFVSISFPGVFFWVAPALNKLPSLSTLFLSLAIIITGVGFLKSNIATLVGALYEHNDPRRESGFTLFYMGINMGGAIGPLICGGIGHFFGLQYGFSAAGIGMLIALVTFLVGQTYLGKHAEPPRPETLSRQILPGFKLEWLFYLGGVLSVIAVWQLLTAYHRVSDILLWFAVGVGAFILYFSFFRCSPQERDRMLAVTLLFLFTIVWASLYMQMFSSLILFADRLVDRTLLGFEVGTSQLQGAPSIFVIILAPIIGYVWLWLARRKRNPNTPVKFSLGLALTGLAFLLPSIAVELTGDQNKIHLLWFLSIYFVMIIGEVCFAPIAMSMVSKLCPKRITSMMMGIFYFTLAIGSIISGELAARYTSLESSPEGELLNISQAIDTYVSSYALFGLIALLTALLLYLLSPFLNLRMHDTSSDHGDSLINHVYRRIGLAKYLVPVETKL